jgi:hypothetical protein
LIVNKKSSQRAQKNINIDVGAEQGIAKSDQSKVYAQKPFLHGGNQRFWLQCMQLHAKLMSNIAVGSPDPCIYLMGD